MSWSGRRVLLTGHTGFKGAWLALWLHRLGAEVTGFAAAPPSTPSLFVLARVGELVRDVRGDVRDAEDVRAATERAAPDVVLHLAAQAIVRRGLEAPAETFAVNVLGTANVLDAARGIPVVVVTSDKCYRQAGPALTAHRHREEDPLGGDEPYAASKAAQEHVAAAYRTAYGVPVATARAGNAIGGGDWGAGRLIPDLVRAERTGAAVALRHPAAVRPWQHVLNPLWGYLRLADALLGGEPVAEAWNFGPDPGDERPVAWLAERWGVPMAAAPADAREATVLRLESAKARGRLSWRPVWDLPAALAATREWHAAVHRGADARTVTMDEIDHFEAST